MLEAAPDAPNVKVRGPEAALSPEAPLERRVRGRTTWKKK
jgi:hypothetical protein